MKTCVSSILILAVGVLCTGCQTYVTPSKRADFAAFTAANVPQDIRDGFAARSAVEFPAGIAFARVQAPNYRSYSTGPENGVWGRGRYSVFLTREVEDEADLARLRALRDVAGVTNFNRLLLPHDLQSDRELRSAAARLKADLLVIYTFDTSFYEKDLSKPLTVLTLGLSPTRRVYVHVTASALVMDTRTGFIHAVLESNEKRTLVTSALGTRENVDTARRDAEKVAFKKLVDEFEQNWRLILDRAKPPPAPAA